MREKCGRSLKKKQARQWEYYFYYCICFGAGALTLAVIMHYSSGEDTIEMFKFEEKKQILIHRKTVRDPLFNE